VKGQKYDVIFGVVFTVGEVGTRFPIVDLYTVLKRPAGRLLLEVWNLKLGDLLLFVIYNIHVILKSVRLLLPS
jgi:hypothetical protein